VLTASVVKKRKKIKTQKYFKRTLTLMLNKKIKIKRVQFLGQTFFSNKIDIFRNGERNETT